MVRKKEVIFHKILTPFTQSNAGESGKVDRSFEGNSHKVMQVGAIR